MPDEKGGDAAHLYELIWRRFVASQMAPTRYTLSGALIHAGKSTDKPFLLVFKASGLERVFDGFLRVYEEPDDGDENHADSAASLPNLKQGQPLELVEVPIHEVQTRAPSRFSEARLVQALENHGVGRPSTYASMVNIIKDKGYVTLKQKRLMPTETGIYLCAFLLEHFPQLFDLGYTARLEAALDRVAAGKLKRHDLLSIFWRGFQPQLTTATEYAQTQLIARQSPKPLVLHPVKE